MGPKHDPGNYGLQYLTHNNCGKCGDYAYVPVRMEGRSKVRCIECDFEYWIRILEIQKGKRAK